MLPQKPRVFISAVTSELSEAREIVASTVRVLGYEAVYQKEFIPQPGKLLDYLRELIDGSAFVIQLVGDKYGAEPRQVPVGYERCSYTQFELLYAEKQHKKILVVECGASVRDAAREIAAALAAPVPEPADHADHDAPVIGRDDRALGLNQPPDEEQAKLQADYLDRIKVAGHTRVKVTSLEGLEIAILKQRKELDDLQKKYRKSMAIIYTLLLAVLGVVVATMIANRRGFGRVEQGIGEMKQGIGDVKDGVVTVQKGIVHVGEEVVGVKEGVNGINTTLKAPSGGNGRLIVDSDPPGATAFLKGVRSTKFPIQVDLPHGLYSYTFHLLGYETEYRDVTLQSGETNDLGIIHLKPLQKKFDPNATYELEQINADVINFLDREIWVNALIDDKTPDLDFMAAGEGARYQYYTAMSTADNASGFGIISKDNRTTWALGRLLPDDAEKLRHDLEEERAKANRRSAAEDEAFLKKAAPEDRGYLRNTRAQFRGRPDPKARIKIRVDSSTYIAGGVDPNVSLYKFVCDFLAWDFTQADQQADKTSATTIAKDEGPKLVISDDDGLGQALFGNESKSSVPAPARAAPLPAQSSSANGPTTYVKGVPVFVAPPPPAASSAALKADAKAADNDLNVVYRQWMDRFRSVPDVQSQIVDLQKRWLASRDRITDLTQQTAFVRQRTNQLRQQMAVYDANMKVYNAQRHR